MPGLDLGIWATRRQERKLLKGFGADLGCNMIHSRVVRVVEVLSMYKRCLWEYLRAEVGFSVCGGAGLYRAMTLFVISCIFAFQHPRRGVVVLASFLC